MKIAELLSPSRWWNSPTVMTWLSLAAKSGGLLLVTPLVLRFFSPAQTSLWFIFLTINALTQMADFGFGPSFVRAMSYARAGRRTLDNAESLLPGPNTALLWEIYAVLGKCYDRLAVVGGLIALLLGSWALAKPIAQLEVHSQGWAGWVIVWVAALLVFRNSAYAQWLQGLNQIAVLRRVEAVLAIATTSLTTIILCSTRSFFWTVAAAAFGAIASSFVVRCLGLAFTSGRSSANSDTSAKAIYSFVWPAAWRSGVGILSCGALIQALGLVYAQFATASQAASYLLAMRVMQALMQTSIVPFYSRIPIFAALYGAGRRIELVNAVRSSATKSYGLFVVSVILCGLLAEPIMELMESQTTFVSRPFWFLLSLAFFIERFGAIHIQFYSLSNNILWHTLNGASGASIIALVVLLFPSQGMVAIPMAMIVSYTLFYASFAAMWSYRHYQLNAFDFELKSSVGPALLLLVVLLIALRGSGFVMHAL